MVYKTRRRRNFSHSTFANMLALKNKQAAKRKLELTGALNTPSKIQKQDETSEELDALIQMAGDEFDGPFINHYGSPMVAEIEYWANAQNPNSDAQQITVEVDVHRSAEEEIEVTAENTDDDGVEKAIGLQFWRTNNGDSDIKQSVGYVSSNS